MTLRQEPGCRVAGKGLRTSCQWGFLRLNSTLLMWSLQSPVLQMVRVRSARQQALTPPKQREPVMTMWPCGAKPETSMDLEGSVGSLLTTVMMPDLWPMLVGSKRMGAWSETPGAMVSG